MHRYNFLGVLIFLLITSGLSMAQIPKAEIVSEESTIIEQIVQFDQPAEKFPGVALAETVSALTGMSVNPILFYGGYGAYKYFDTPEPQRTNLPWTFHPITWGIALSLCGLTVFLDLILGATNIAPLKSLQNTVEIINENALLVVAGGATVPMLVKNLANEFVLGNANTALSMTASVFSPNLALIELSQFQLQLIMMPIALLIIFVVFMAVKILDSFILLSPFGFIDSVLKLIKTLIPATILGLYAINPYLGLAFVLIIIGLSLASLPLAFRMVGFSTKMVKEILLTTFTKPKVTTNQYLAYIKSKKTTGIPTFTTGILSKNSDSLTFSYKKLGLFPRKVKLPEINYTMHKGLISPYISAETEAEEKDAISLFRRNKGSETEISIELGIDCELESRTERVLSMIKSSLIAPFSKIKLKS